MGTININTLKAGLLKDKKRKTPSIIVGIKVLIILLGESVCPSLELNIRYMPTVTDKACDKKSESPAPR